MSLLLQSQLVLVRTLCRLRLAREGKHKLPNLCLRSVLEGHRSLRVRQRGQGDSGAALAAPPESSPALFHDCLHLSFRVRFRQGSLEIR